MKTPKSEEIEAVIKHAQKGDKIFRKQKYPHRSLTSQQTANKFKIKASILQRILGITTITKR